MPENSDLSGSIFSKRNMSTKFQIRRSNSSKRDADNERDADQPNSNRRHIRRISRPRKKLHVNERKLDEAGASEINRLYPESRRKDEKKDQHLKSLSRRGRLEEENGRTRTKLEYVTRARMEERRKGA
ncbi:hypothetical protein TNCV_3325541 [Trichonephila clavipes]|nr:hypothetical protein TNCV_3325541 [Trichonephila clavipes]